MALEAIPAPVETPAPKSGRSYRARLESDLSEVIAGLPLADPQRKAFLRARWMDQVLWMEKSAEANSSRYSFFRVTAIIGGVIVPALVSQDWGPWDLYRRTGTIVLSLVVAASTALQEFFHFGDRWRHYRLTAEQLKSEGWEFFQLAGHYSRYATHDDAYPAFAGRVERVNDREVERYITEITPERKDERAELNTLPRGGHTADRVADSRP